jgi:hypothetical protein
MKRFVSFLAALLLVICIHAEEFSTGGVFVNSASPNLEANLVGKTTNLVEKVIVGRTYYVDADVWELRTKAGESATLNLSNGVQINVDPSTTFSVDSFNQMVSNFESEPSTLSAAYSVASLSLLDGQVEIVSPKQDTNSQIILSTPFVNVNVAAGRISVKSNPKYVIISALEGSVVVVDTKNKKSIIDKGNLGLIIPYPGRDSEILVTQKPIASEDLQKLSKIGTALEQQSKDVLWVVAYKKVVGVRLK